MVEKMRKQLLIFWWMVAISLTYISIFIYSQYRPFSSDEFNYSHIAWTDHKLNGIRDILASMILLYENWTGRIPLHFLISFFLYIGKIFFSIFNATVYVVILLLIAWHAHRKGKVKVLTFLIASALLLYQAPVFSETVIWLSGSINYLWSSTLLLLFITLYKNDSMHNYILNNFTVSVSRVLSKNILNFLLFIGSILVGWSQENVALLGASFIFLYILENRKKYKKIFWYGIVGYFLGFFLLFFAPGNFRRVGSAGINIDASKVIDLINFNQELIILALFILFIQIIFNRKLLKQNYKYLLASLISILPLAIFPETPSRSSFAFSIFIIIFIVSGMNFLLEKLKLKIIASIVLAVSIGFTLTSINAFYVQIVRKDLMQESYLINYNHVMNNRDLVLYQYQMPKEKYSRYYGAEPLSPFSDSVINFYFSRYYGINSVRGVGKGQKLLVLKTSYKNSNIQIRSIEQPNMIFNQIQPYNTMPGIPHISDQEILFQIPENLNNIQIILPDEVDFDLNNIIIYSIGETQNLDPKFISKNVQLKGNVSIKVVNNLIKIKTGVDNNLNINLPELKNKIIKKY